jgi:hypothetical protein
MKGDAEGAAGAIAGLLRLEPARRISSLHDHVQACCGLLRGPAVPPLPHSGGTGAAARRIQRRWYHPGTAWWQLMTRQGLAPSANGLSKAAPRALAYAARHCGLDDAGARLIRMFGTAVYHLPAAGAVARTAMVPSPQSTERLATSVRVTRWLALPVSRQ